MRKTKKFGRQTAKSNKAPTPALLKQKLNEQIVKYQTLKEQYQTKETEYRKLEEKHLTLVRKFFGKRSEKLTPEDESQGRLFNEAEDGHGACEDDTHKENDPATTVKAHERKKRGRKPLPDDLPREEIIHDISDEEKRRHCCGKSRRLIGTEESEERRQMILDRFAFLPSYRSHNALSQIIV